jgi:hypothetical protein
MRRLGVTVTNKLSSARWFGRCLVVATAAVAVGCNTPAVVAKFCSAAVATLGAGDPIFADMKASCLREVNSRSPLASFAIAKDDDSECAEIGKQAAAARAASQVLADYFAAVNALASFDSGKVGTSAGDLVNQASGIAKAGTNTKTALEALGTFLVTAATSGYQQRQLARDLPQESQHAIVVLDALTAIVRDDYVGRLLKPEEEKLAAQYKEFVAAQKGSTLSAEAQLALYDRWRSDDGAISARRATAEKFVTGLRSMSKGLSTLAATKKHEKLIALLEPYATQSWNAYPCVQRHSSLVEV